jgi:uncharacterized repeat protein (TIGR03803 family)
VKSIRYGRLRSVVIALIMPLLAAAAHAQTYSVLHKFQGQPDGAYPSAVIQDATGNLYGTTENGGAYTFGTVFKLSKAGETVLYSFCPGGDPCTDGISPRAGLIRDAAGNLYGTTYGGGMTGRGVVFEVDTTGTYSVLYNFAGGLDGSGPMAGLIQDASGNFYGTTLAVVPGAITASAVGLFSSWTLTGRKLCCIASPDSDDNPMGNIPLPE